jgi:hypothetical protein
MMVCWRSIIAPTVLGSMAPAVRGTPIKATVPRCIGVGANGPADRQFGFKLVLASWMMAEGQQ